MILEDWQIIGNFFTTLGVIVAAYGIYMNTLRAKKELAVKLLNEWSTDYSLSMKHGLSLLNSFGGDKVKKIINKSEQVAIDRYQNEADSIDYILGESVQWLKEEIRELKEVEDENGALNKIILTVKQCTVIDYEWVRLLHRVEAIVMAWATDAAHRRTIEQQFLPLLKYNREAFSKVLTVRRGEFPNIESYFKDRFK